MKKTIFFMMMVFLGVIASSPILPKSEKRKMDKLFKGSAIFFVKNDKVVSFKNEVSKIIGPSLKEKGCISYEAFQVLDEQGRPTSQFEFHELWTSRSAMMIDHKDNTSHMKNFFAAIRIGEQDSWIEKVEISGHDVEVLQ